MPGYQFDLAFPKDYASDKRRFPLLLFLHGVGERGEDLSLVRRHGPPLLASSKPRPVFLEPFLVLSPQCPSDESWSPPLLVGLLDDVIGKFAVDPRQVYLTGISMGGYGAWQLVLQAPERFAAVAPICGGGDPSRAGQLKGVPVWIFHSAADTVVPVGESDKMFDALAACAAEVTYTRYQARSHEQTWQEAYAHAMLYDWFLRHARGTAPLPDG